jgi:hypothetical protein
MPVSSFQEYEVVKFSSAQLSWQNDDFHRFGMVTISTVSHAALRSTDMD